MKFRRTPQFKKDAKKLNRADAGFEAFLKENFPLVQLALTGDAALYSKFRIKPMGGFTDIWEGHLRDNLCFTFHYDEGKEGEKICFFRRIGTHEIYKLP